MWGKQLLIRMAICLIVLALVNGIIRPAPAFGGSMENIQGLLDKADQQRKRLDVPKAHDDEAEKAARKAANIYHSREYQARLHKEITRLKNQLFPDAITQAKNAASAKAAENAFLLPDERLYLFVSSSMPISTLRNYAADLDKLNDPHISMIMRGFVDGMHYIKPTIKFIEKILVKDLTCDASNQKCDLFHATVNVDPLLYSRYGIERVPAILYVRGIHSIDPGESEGIEDNVTVSDVYMVSGDVSLEYALDTIRKASKSSQVEGILKELRRGFY